MSGNRHKDADGPVGQVGLAAGAAEALELK